MFFKRQNAQKTKQACVVWTSSIDRFSKKKMREKCMTLKRLSLSLHVAKTYGPFSDRECAKTRASMWKPCDPIVEMKYSPKRGNEQSSWIPQRCLGRQILPEKMFGASFRTEGANTCRAMRVACDGCRSARKSIAVRCHSTT